MENVIEFGTDIDSSWTFNSNGDLKLISNTENLGQAILNRLKTYQDSLELFYADYGSVLTQYLGWLGVVDTLEFMRIEIEGVLELDPRISEVFAEVTYTGQGTININITATYDDEDVELNLTLSENGEFTEV